MLRDLVPSFLYGAGSQSAAPSSAAAVSAAASSSSTMMATSTPLLSSSPSSFQQRRAPVVAFAPSEAKIELYSPKYYGVCAVGGALCCGLTHTAVTPLDVVKCNMQINPAKYPGIAAGFGVTARELPNSASTSTSRSEFGSQLEGIDEGERVKERDRERKGEKQRKGGRHDCSHRSTAAAAFSLFPPSNKPDAHLTFRGRFSPRNSAFCFLASFPRARA